MIKVIGIAVIVCGIASATAGFFGYKKGYDYASAVHLQHMQERETELLQLVNQAQGATLEAERIHTASVAAIHSDYERQATEQAAQAAAIIADLRDSNQRVRIKVTDCDNPAVPASSSAAGIDNGSRTAELDGQVAARIWAIAADGERAIAKLTALQQWANKAVLLCSDNNKPTGSRRTNNE